VAAYNYVVQVNQSFADLAASLIDSRNAFVNQTNQAWSEAAIQAQLDSFHAQLALAIQNGSYHGNTETMAPTSSWTFQSGFLLSVSLFSTIGYGNIVASAS